MKGLCPFPWNTCISRLATQFEISDHDILANLVETAAVDIMLFKGQVKKVMLVRRGNLDTILK